MLICNLIAYHISSEGGCETAVIHARLSVCSASKHGMRCVAHLNDAGFSEAGLSQALRDPLSLESSEENIRAPSARAHELQLLSLALIIGLLNYFLIIGFDGWVDIYMVAEQCF